MTKPLLLSDLDNAVRETVRSLGSKVLERPIPLQRFLDSFNPRVAPHQIGLRRIYASLRRQGLMYEAED